MSGTVLLAALVICASMAMHRVVKRALVATLLAAALAAAAFQVITTIQQGPIDDWTVALVRSFILALMGAAPIGWCIAITRKPR